MKSVSLRKEQVKIIHDKVDEWDNTESVCRAVEELNELAADLLRFKRGRISLDKLKEEIADVRIALEHLEYRYGNYQKQLDEKIEKNKK